MVSNIFTCSCWSQNSMWLQTSKPLLRIIKNQKPTTACIQWWHLWLKPYTSCNDLSPADSLGQHLKSKPKCDNAAEAYIKNVCKNVVQKSVSLEEVRTGTDEDCRIIKHAKAVQMGLSDYARFKNEVSVSHGIILQDNRLVIPEPLQESHQNRPCFSPRHSKDKAAHSRRKCSTLVLTRELNTVKWWTPCLAPLPRYTHHKPLSMTIQPSGPWELQQTSQVPFLSLTIF